MEKIISWICIDCGLKHSKKSKEDLRGQVSTFHNGKCDVCGEDKSVTAGRDYGVYKI